MWNDEIPDNEDSDEEDDDDGYFSTTMPSLYVVLFNLCFTPLSLNLQLRK